MYTRIEQEKVVPRFRSRRHALWWMSRWYYPSDHWVKLSRSIRKKHPFCQRCKFRKSYQTHHLSYEHLWQEKESELMACCKKCHEYLERQKTKNRLAKNKG